jgi:hypothetical protein
LPRKWLRPLGVAVVLAENRADMPELASELGISELAGEGSQTRINLPWFEVAAAQRTLEPLSAALHPGVSRECSFADKWLSRRFYRRCWGRVLVVFVCGGGVGAVVVP